MKQKLLSILTLLLIGISSTLGQTTVTIFDGTVDDAKSTKSTHYVSGTEYTDVTTGFKYTCKGNKDALVNTSEYSKDASVTKTYTNSLQQGGSTASSNCFELKVPTGYKASVFVAYAITGSKTKYIGLNKSSALQPNGKNCSEWNASIGENTEFYAATISELATGTYYLTGNSSNNVFGEIKVTLTVASSTPTLTGGSSSPVANATGVAVSGSGYLKFSKNLSSVDASKITISPNSNGEALSSIAIDGTDASKVNYAWSGLQKETEYTINIAAAAVSDGTNTNTATSLSFTTVEKTSLTAAWSEAAPEFEIGTVATIPTFSVTGGTLGTDYTVAYSKTDASGIVTLTDGTGAISTINTSAAATATVTATVTVTNTADYKIATTAYDCAITVAVAKTPVTLSFDETSFVSLKSASFTKPTLTSSPSVSGITYSVSGPSGTSVDSETGEVTIGSTAGLATVTATFAGDATYEAATASYTIAIGDAPTSTPNNWDFSKLGDTYEEYLLRAEAAKTGAKTWSQPSGKNDRFQNAVDLNNATLTANGFDLKITDGLKFTATATNLRIDKESGNKRMWLGSNAVIIIPNCKQGQLITISMKNSGSSGTRSLTLTNMAGGDIADGKWTVGTTTTTFTGYVNTDDDVTMTVETGLNIYTLTVTDPVAVTISANKYATFSSTEKLDFTGTGLTVYKATSTTASSVSLTEVSGIVPANTGLLLYADVDASTTYYIPVSTPDPTADVTGNLLQSTASAAHDITEGEYGRAYVFGKLGDEVGFFKAATGKTVGQGKSYLLLSAGAKEVEFFSLSTEEDHTTHISTLDYRTSTLDTNAPIYNLSGQRVSESYKGVVIQNGKTYIIK